MSRWNEQPSAWKSARTTRQSGDCSYRFRFGNAYFRGATSLSVRFVILHASQIHKGQYVCWLMMNLVITRKKTQRQRAVTFAERGDPFFAGRRKERPTKPFFILENSTSSSCNKSHGQHVSQRQHFDKRGRCTHRCKKGMRTVVDAEVRSSHAENTASVGRQASHTRNEVKTAVANAAQFP